MGPARLHRNNTLVLCASWQATKLLLSSNIQPPEQQIVVGICCMMKKSKSKPMTQILERLCRFEYITVVIFPEDVILNETVDKWPLCDCLISFHSKGIPLISFNFLYELHLTRFLQLSSVAPIWNCFAYAVESKFRLIRLIPILNVDSKKCWIYLSHH